MTEPLRCNILLVDDHPLVLEGITHMFREEAQFEICSTFGSAEAVLADLVHDHNNVDIIISDIGLPGKTGIDLCREVKLIYPRIKVLMLSMYSTHEVVRQAVDAEADGYILKSAPRAEVLRAVERIMDDGAYYTEELLPILLNKYPAAKLPAEPERELSKRELEVLQLIVNECTSEEIADQLFISKKTVDHHRQHLLEKTRSRSTVGLVKYAMWNLGMKG